MTNPLCRPGRGRIAALGVSLLLLLAAGLPGLASAQNCPDVNPNEEIKLNIMDLGLGALEMFFISDFDPSATSGHPLLFRFEVTNTGAVDRSLVLQFIVDSDEGILLEGESAPFALSPGETKSATNQDLSEPSSPFDLDSFDISDAGDALEDVILETGFLPQGEYSFLITIFDEIQGDELRNCSITVSVSNPRTVTPIIPGDLFSGDLPIESNPNPQFQWQSNGSRFNFRICPVFEGDGGGEEVMENQPVYEELDFATGFAGTHTYLYPPSAEALEQGKGYCWQVEILVPTSGGEVVFTGDIFCFEYSSGIPTEVSDQLIGTLVGGLPPGALDEILAELPGFQTTGVVTVDDVEFTQAQLQILLETLLAEGWEIGNMEIE